LLLKIPGAAVSTTVGGAKTMNRNYSLPLVLIIVTASYIVAYFPVLAEPATTPVPDENATLPPSPSSTATPLNSEVEAFKQAMLIAGVVTACVFGAGFLIYFKKRGR
jgi:hypothetical protein